LFTVRLFFCLFICFAHGRYSATEDHVQHVFAIDDIIALERDASDPLSLVVALSTTATAPAPTGYSIEGGFVEAGMRAPSAASHRRVASGNDLPRLAQVNIHFTFTLYTFVQYQHAQHRIPAHHPHVEHHAVVYRASLTRTIDLAPHLKFIPPKGVSTVQVLCASRSTQSLRVAVLADQASSVA
jgi:hypothetical protein